MNLENQNLGKTTRRGLNPAFPNTCPPHFPILSKLPLVPGELAAQLSPQQLEAARMIFRFGQQHRYDEHDRRIETSWNMAPNDFDRETFTYNHHGDVIWKVSELSHAEYDFGEAGQLTPKPDSIRSHRSETQFRYQYDPHGNWVEKIAEAPAGKI